MYCITYFLLYCLLFLLAHLSTSKNYYNCVCWVHKNQISNYYILLRKIKNNRNDEDLEDTIIEVEA